jgi:sugar phosphate isomerase/epimerase
VTGLLVHLEWLAWSKIPDLATARAVVDGADRSNSGLNVDTWHCARTGTTTDELRALPGHRVLAVQLDDGPAEPEDNLIEATLRRRLLPGEGDFDLTGYLNALADIGVTAPTGVEVFSDDLHALGAAEAAARAATATRAVIGAARGVASPAPGAAPRDGSPTGR